MGKRATRCLDSWDIFKSSMLCEALLSIVKAPEVQWRCLKPSRAPLPLATLFELHVAVRLEFDPPVLSRRGREWPVSGAARMGMIHRVPDLLMQATEKTLEQLVGLWCLSKISSKRRGHVEPQRLWRRRPEDGELLIRHALLDVLRALVLMHQPQPSPGFAQGLLCQ